MLDLLPRLRAVSVAVLIFSVIAVLGRVASASGGPLVLAPTSTTSMAAVAAAAADTATTSSPPPETTDPVPTTEATTTVPDTTTSAPAPPPAPRSPDVPSGVGMWIWLPEATAGGDPAAIAASSQAAGFTHLYVRTGSSVDGFNAAEFLDGILPAAHAAGIRVIGWDFPYLDDPGADVTRALQAISYTTPSGDKLDGFSADIETPAEGVALSMENAAAYGTALRAAVGPSYLLIATVPRPSAARQGTYPYTEVVQSFDAIAPMDYWIDVPPDEVAEQSVDFFAPFGKPVLPIGQAYDGGLEGGPPGTPTYNEVGAFIAASFDSGAKSVSFWSWQHASGDVWDAIKAGAAAHPK